MLGAASGAVAGLVAVTPAAGFAGPMGAIVLGVVAGAGCFFAVTVVKNALGYDDSLDVFGIHGIGGIIGALGTGILVNPALGGAGIVDYSTPISPPATPARRRRSSRSQGRARDARSGPASAASSSTRSSTSIVGLRPTPEVEREGLDLTSHGEVAYHT